MTIRVIIIVIPSSLGILSSVGCQAESQDTRQASRELLTVEQTLGLVFDPLFGVSRRCLFKQANPDASPALRKILKDKALSQYHEEVWWILGYIGDESDVERLEKSFEQDFSGVLEGVEGHTVQAMFGALGLMVARKVKGSDKLANKLRTPEYWKKAPFRWFEKRQPQRPSHEYESIIRMMIGYSLCMDPDLDKKCAAIVQGIEDPNEKEIMQKALNPKLMLSHAKATRAEENKPIADEQRERLSSYFNGDLEDPGPANLNR